MDALGNASTTAGANGTGAPSGPNDPGPLTALAGPAATGRGATTDTGAAPAAGHPGAGVRAVRLGLLATMALSLPQPGSDLWLQAMLRNLVVSSTVGVATAMALFLFGRRKQEEGDSEEARRRSQQDAAGGPDGQDPMVTQGWTSLPDESNLPRWRRPSLMAARKGAPAPTTAEEAATRLTFDRGLVEADARREHRRIRYRMVRLSDAPDEIRSNELGRLDRGDEVELLENVGAYWKVRVPTGQVGWVHRMTLGDPVSARTAPHPGGPAYLSAGPHAASDTDSSGASEGDPSAEPAERPGSDVFAARPSWQPVAPEEPAGEGLAAQLIRRRHGN